MKKWYRELFGFNWFKEVTVNPEGLKNDRVTIRELLFKLSYVTY